MDYKQVVEVLDWHSKFTKMNGATARVLGRILANQNYKTSIFSESQYDIAKALNITPASAHAAIASLVASEAIVCVKGASGRAPGAYKVRSVEDLNGIYLNITDNGNAVFKWQNDQYEIFKDVFRNLNKIGDGCEKCIMHEDDSYVLCSKHQHQMDKFKQSLEYRKMMLWEADNPKPPEQINTIKGRVVI